MNTIACINQKGGTGKTTLAISIAITLAHQGQRVLLLDADYQGTTTQWGGFYADTFKVTVYSQVQETIKLEQAVKRSRNAFDTCIIDAPPTLSNVTVGVLQQSDVVLIPIRPALPDLWSLPRLAALVDQINKVGHVLTAKVILNQYQNESLAPLQPRLIQCGLPIHPQPLPFDPAFAALFSGQSLPFSLERQIQNLLSH
ncbi:MAG: ParA family protein [Pseudomonadota bacterium]|nr:ParA family protein [Pseudomonadota bacterium]